MWIKKNPEEIRKVELYRLKVFLSFFTFIFLVLFFGEKFIGAGSHRFVPGYTDPLKWNEVIDRIPIYLIKALIATTIGLKLDYYLKRKEKDKYICDKCNKYKQNEKEDLCECGGNFVDIDKMKRIEE